MEKTDAVRLMIHIIHNISRHNDGINSLNSCDARSVIKHVQLNIILNDTDELNSKIRTILSLLLKASVTTATQIISATDTDDVDETMEPVWDDYDDSEIEEEAKNFDISHERIFSDVLKKLDHLKLKISKEEETHDSKEDKSVSSADTSDESSSSSNSKSSKTKDNNPSETDDEERLDKAVLIEWYHILTELVDIIEDNKVNITKLNYFAVRKKTKPISEIIKDSQTYLHNDDVTYAHEIFYLYFAFFNLPHIKNYLQSKNTINHAVKLLYENCILPNVFHTLESAFQCAFCATSFTTADLQQLVNYNGILVLMIDYIKEYYNSNEFPKCSRTIVLLLDFLNTYSDKTELVPNMIKLGLPESCINIIKVVHEYVSDLIEL